MTAKQVTEQDLRNLTDQAAEPADRAEALMRLAHWEKGQYDRLEPTIVGLLDDASAMVRGGAIKTLLAWQRDSHVESAIRLLQTDHDEDWTARANAAYALGNYALNTGRSRERIIRALTAALRHDPEWPVQEQCYESLLQLLRPEQTIASNGGEFDRERDVDWELLRPYIGA